MSHERDVLIDRLEKKLNDKERQLKEAQESLEHFLKERSEQEEVLGELSQRLTQLERRVAEINSRYDGLMRELLDQKSLIQSLTKTQPQSGKTTPKSDRSTPTQKKTPLETPSSEDDIIVAEDEPLPGPEKKNHTSGQQHASAGSDIIET